jgi:CSLREA domain-containing protein
LLLLCCLWVFGLAGVVPNAACAAIITVNTLADDSSARAGLCSLR